MFKQLTYPQKNRLLVPVTAVVFVLCWYLAFSKTFEALLIHRELTQQSSGAEDLSYNPAYQERKLAALQKIWKSYRVNKTEWGNELWMKTSALALRENVGIDYTQALPVTDTTAIGKTEIIYCYGDYVQLVKLIDTLERTPGIGIIAALQVKAPKKDMTGERANQCSLKLEFKGLTDLQ